MENPFQFHHFPFLPLLNPPSKVVLVDGYLRTFMPLTVTLISYYYFSSPTLSSIPDLKPFSANPSHCSLSFSFFFRTNYMIPQTFTVTSNISAFTFQFFCFTNFSCRLRAVD